VGQLTARKLLAHHEYGINLVGFVDSEPKERRSDLGHLTLLGPPEELPEMIKLLDVERVIIAFSNDSHEETLDLIRSITDLDVQIDIVPRLFEVLGANVGIHTVEGVPLISLPPLRLSRSSRLLKRAMDVVIAALALVVLTPLFVVVALAIKVTSRGPVFFRQIRMGEGDKTFRIFKFRTMSADAESQKQNVAYLNMHARGDSRMFKIPNDPRVTRVGSFLRRSSLDELPQLLNVLKGEMSLVGPRPLILDEDQHVEDWARKRLSLRPGITGLWQVLGRSDIPFEEMTKLDYLYVTNWSLGEDLRLIFLTLPALARSRAAY
jgi:exopolysaccharide biosynthesis polyprenyl glycosylphosphotransferase